MVVRARARFFVRGRTAVLSDRGLGLVEAPLEALAVWVVPDGDGTWSTPEPLCRTTGPEIAAQWTRYSLRSKYCHCFSCSI